MGELRAVQRPMLRWWLRVGSWWIGSALILGVAEVAGRTLIAPWLDNVAGSFSHADQMGVAGPLGLTFTKWHAAFNGLLHLRLLIYLACWVLAADYITRIRAALVQEQALPATSRHRQAAYLHAVLAGSLPLLLILIESILEYRHHVRISVTPHLQMMLILLVPFVVLRQSRWIAWVWAFGLEVLLPSISALYLDYYYFANYVHYGYQSYITQLAEVTAETGFAWELGGLLLLGTLWLLARGYVRQTAPLLLILSISGLLNSLEEFTTAPQSLQGYTSWEPAQPDTHAGALFDLIRGPQQFMYSGLCTLDVDRWLTPHLNPDSCYLYPEIDSRIELQFEQPVRFKIEIPAQIWFLPSLLNLCWTLVLGCIVYFLVLPEPRREETLL